MELFIDPNLLKTIKPLGIAALGLAAVFSNLASMIAIAYTFNKFVASQQEEKQREEHVQIEKNKPAGIYNQGNTCFVNSLLQALAPLKSFIANLEQLTEFAFGHANPSEQLLIQLKQSLLKINKESESVQITKFLNSISNFSQIINLQQQDAYELFSIIVDCLQSVQNESKSINLCRSTLSAQDNQLQQTFINCSTQAQQSHNTNTLLGYTKSSILCQGCHQQINIKIHPFYNLSFDISLPRIRTLEDAINHFQDKEIIQDWVCTRCSLKEHLRKLGQVRKELEKGKGKGKDEELLGEVCEKIQKFLGRSSFDQMEIHEVNNSLGEFVKKYEKEYLEIGDKNQYRDRVFVQIHPVSRTIVKQCVISKFPKILALHLKQLSINPMTGQPMLLRKRIGFPKTLKIPVKTGFKNYELVSLIAHSGNESFGHYFTFRKLNSGTQKWFFISDTTSQQCKQSFLQVHMPYMLFYQLAEP